MPIVRRGSSWQVTVNWKGDRYRRQFTDEASAQVWEAESKAHLLKGEPVELGESTARSQAGAKGVPYTLQELFEWVKATHWSGNKSESQIKNGAQITRLLGPDKAIKSIDRAALDRLVSHLRAEGASPSTVNKKVSAFNVMFKAAEELDLIDKRPRRRQFKEAEGRIRRFTPEEQKLVLGYYAMTGDCDMIDYVKLSLATGMRQSEVMGLHETHVSDKAFVKVFGPDAKGKRNRAIPVLGEAAEIIDSRRKAAIKGRLFPGLNKVVVRTRWNDMRARLGFAEDENFVPHILRHEFCSRLADLGVSAQHIQALAGHEDIKTTMRYIHLSPVTLIKTMEMFEAARIPTPKVDTSATIYQET